VVGAFGDVLQTQIEGGDQTGQPGAGLTPIDVQ
jgi:hypothetical protein